MIKHFCAFSLAKISVSFLVSLLAPLRPSPFSSSFSLFPAIPAPAASIWSYVFSSSSSSFPPLSFFSSSAARENIFMRSNLQPRELTAVERSFFLPCSWPGHVYCCILSQGNVVFLLKGTQRTSRNSIQSPMARNVGGGVPYASHASVGCAKRTGKRPNKPPRARFPLLPSYLGTRRHSSHRV